MKKLKKNSWQQNMILSILQQFCLFYTKVATFFFRTREGRREAHELLTTKVSSRNSFTLSLISVDSEYPDLVHVRELCNN
jgi:hypothetical protein